MVKSKYGHCTKEYLLLFLAQTIFCISVTVFFIRAELADLGKPAAEQHGDPEMHEILLGERSGVPTGKPVLSNMHAGVFLPACWIAFVLTVCPCCCNLPANWQCAEFLCPCTFMMSTTHGNSVACS